MGTMRRLLLGLVFTAMLAGGAAAQYCAEGDIACDERWYQLEETLFAYEQAAGAALGPEAARCLAADSAHWHTALAQTCLGGSCRSAAYAERLSSLLVFLPEAEPPDGLDFVTTPQLVTVLAPEAEAPEPDDQAGLDADVYGTLAHASADPDHMGLAVTDGAGEHVVIFDMDMGNQAGHDVLQSLIADEPGQRFLVRGAADEAGNFKPNQCRLVYRMPIPDN